MQYRILMVALVAVITAGCPDDGLSPDYVAPSSHNVAGSAPYEAPVGAAGAPAEPAYDPEPIDSEPEPAVDAGAPVEPQPEPAIDAGSPAQPVAPAPMPDPAVDAGAPAAGSAAPEPAVDAGAPAAPTQPEKFCRPANRAVRDVGCDEVSTRYYPHLAVSWRIGTTFYNCHVLDAPRCVTGSECSVQDLNTGRTYAGMCL